MLPLPHNDTYVWYLELIDDSECTADTLSYGRVQWSIEVAPVVKVKISGSVIYN